MSRLRGSRASTGGQGPSGERALPGAAGLLGRWGIPGLDPGALRRLGQELLYRADPDAVEERERKRFERRHLSFGFTLDDTGTLSGACGDTLSLEIIKTAVHTLGPPLGTGDTRTAAQRRMDGLSAACQAARTPAGRHPARRRPAPQHPGRRQTLAGAAGTAKADQAESRGRRNARRQPWWPGQRRQDEPGDRPGGPARPGPARPGPARPGPVRPGPARTTLARRKPAAGASAAGRRRRWGRPRPGPDSGPCSPPGRSSPWPATPS